MFIIFCQGKHFLADLLNHFKMSDKRVILEGKHFQNLPQELKIDFDVRFEQLKQKSAKYSLEVFFTFDVERSNGKGRRGILVRGYVSSQGFDKFNQENRFTGGSHGTLCRFYYLSNLKKVQKAFEEMEEIIDFFGPKFPLSCPRQRRSTSASSVSKF